MYKLKLHSHSIYCCYVASNSNGIYQVTINDSANNKLIKITIPVILGQLAPTFLDAVDDVIIVPVREDTQPHSVVATFRVMDLNNGKLCSVYLLRFNIRIIMMY